MKLSTATYRLKFVPLIALGVLIFNQSFAQKPVSVKAKPGIAKSGNRLDACIQRNRKLTTDITTLNQIVSRQSNQIVSQEGMLNYYQNSLKAVRDSSSSSQKAYEDQISKDKSEIELLRKTLQDSIASFTAFRDEILQGRQRIVKDTNVIRVYNLPYDQVRVKVLRKVLDEGTGLLIERNTDEGFLVSKKFKDRKGKGLFGKPIETRVDCDIKMVQHPYEDNKTLFYATTRVQEKQKKNRPYIELTDGVIIRDYQKKLLKFFDDFLVVK